MEERLRPAARIPAERNYPIPQSDSQHQGLGERVKRIAERDGCSAARLLRLGRLLNAIAASLAMSGTELGEKRVADAEQGCPKQQ
jgi:hypothetical protein